MVGAWCRNAGGDHVAVADRLDLLEPVPLRELVEVTEHVIEVADHRGGREPLRPGREVHHVGEQDRGRLELVRDRLSLAFSRSAIERGRMFSRSLSALACSSRSAASASRRWLANTASSVNTMAPPTAMLRASIVLVNQLGSGDQIGPTISPAIPDPRNTTRHATYQRVADRDVAEHERPERGEDPPQADAAGVEESAERDHRQRRREQDVDLADPQQQREVARAREHGDRTEQDAEVHERHHTDRRSEREVQRPPQRRDRQDQHGDQDQQRLSSTQVLVVVGIRADKRQARGDASRRLSDPVPEVHRPRRYLWTVRRLRPPERADRGDDGCD